MCRLEHKAAAANAKVRGELPLFADQVPLVTREALYWRWRRQKAMIEGSEPGGFGAELLDKFKEAFLRRLALTALPAEVMRDIQEYREGTYPRAGSGYGSRFWVEVLTAGKCLPAGLAPPFTRDQIDAVLLILPPQVHPGAVDPLGLGTRLTDMAP